MIKRKIRLGIFFIATLLFFSGIISFGEWNRLSDNTSTLLSASKGNIDMCKTLLDCAHSQNALLLNSIQDSVGVSPEMASLRQDFDKTLERIDSLYTQRSKDSVGVKRIELAAQAYNNDIMTVQREITLEWFTSVYVQSYEELQKSIKEFMILSEDNILSSANEIENNAYRANMLGVIALGAGVLLLFLFYFILNGFYISPVLNISRSLHAHLERGTPFKVEIATKDEIAGLASDISALIEKNKKSRGF